MSIAPTPRTVDHSEPPRVRPPAPWVWMVASCALLAGSASVRLWQEWRYQAAFENASTPLFPLRDIPMKFGDWSCQGEQELPKETLTIAGSTDYIAREYVDDKTGATVLVMVVFGPAERVFGHSPLVCFPAVGYQLAAAATPRPISLSTEANTPEARFDSLVYSKSNGSSQELVETLYSFWHHGTWDPAASSTRKQFRHHPEMFKVQIQRLITPTENRTNDNNPSVVFLDQFMPELQKRIDQAITNPSAPTPEKTAE